MATKKLGPTLETINAQIAALQAQADAIRTREVGDVVAKIKDAIAHYGLTAADLGLSRASPKAAKAPTAEKPRRKSGGKTAGAVRKPKTSRAAKYTDGQGRTWSGIGKRPDGFKAALAAGKTADELLVKA
jgi:DNA-binding protein H-NS